MNLFRKIYSPWLSIPGVAIIILLLALIFRPASTRYKLNAKESLQLLKDNSLIVKQQDLSGQQLIDIRPPELYSQGHPADAMNIPVRQLLDKESLELFDMLRHDGKETVLFGTDELQATAPLFLLQQLGYYNLKLLAGGFTPQNGFKESDTVSTEVPLITDSSMLNKQGNTPKTEVKKSKKQTVIPVRKKASSGGGC